MEKTLQELKRDAVKGINEIFKAYEAKIKDLDQKIIDSDNEPIPDFTSNEKRGLETDDGGQWHEQIIELIDNRIRDKGTLKVLQELQNL